MVLTKEKVRGAHDDTGHPPREPAPQTPSTELTHGAPPVSFDVRQAVPCPPGLLKLGIPLSVRVAERSMRVRAILDLTPGSIVEFDTPASSELDLMANNRLIARGLAVKVGEKFGLKVTRLLAAPDPAD